MHLKKHEKENVSFNIMNDIKKSNELKDINIENISDVPCDEVMVNINDSVMPNFINLYGVRGMIYFD